jgi:hypothetical protein
MEDSTRVPDQKRAYVAEVVRRIDNQPSDRIAVSLEMERVGGEVAKIELLGPGMCSLNIADIYRAMRKLEPLGQIVSLNYIGPERRARRERRQWTFVSYSAPCRHCGQKDEIPKRRKSDKESA